MPFYTLVQHSGFVIAGKTEFKNAVEEASIDANKRTRIIQAGGLVFNSYKDAYDAALDASYPKDVKGLIARAPGTFHRTIKIGGLALYVPPRK